jgi:hypothetical protein
MFLQDIIEIAQEYESLSNSEKESLNNIMAGEAIAKQDKIVVLPGLVNLLDWMAGYNEASEAAVLRDYISDYLDNPESVPPRFTMPTPHTGADINNRIRSGTPHPHGEAGKTGSGEWREADR